MSKNLKDLFESAILTEETRAVLQEAFDDAVLAKEVEIREQYETKIAEEVKQISESTQGLIEEAIADHLEQFADEIAHARTLEVNYANKLEMFKESFTERNDEILNVLVAECVAEELVELQESIEEAKQIKFALSLFESFKDTYETLFGGAESLSAIAELREAKAELDAFKRNQKIAELTESLTGSKRKVAETILESVAFDKLESQFASIKPLLLAEGKKAVKEEDDYEDSDEDKDEADDSDEEKQPKMPMKEQKMVGKKKMVVKEGVIVMEESLDEQPSKKVTSVQAANFERLQRSLRSAINK